MNQKYNNNKKPGTNRHAAALSALGQKLNLVRRDIKTQKSNSYVLPAINQQHVDGVNHINIWERASTELGLALSHKIDIKFDHPDFGRFKSVEGFWHWLRDKNHDDRHRQSHGMSAKRMAQNSEVIPFVPNFKFNIMMANWVKVKSYPYLVEAMIDSELPFEMYFENRNRDSGKTLYVRPASAFWLVPGFEEIRAALKEGREPNFDHMRDPVNPLRDTPVEQQRFEAPREVHKAKLSATLLQQVNGTKATQEETKDSDTQSNGGIELTNVVGVATDAVETPASGLVTADIGYIGEETPMQPETPVDDGPMAIESSSVVETPTV